MVRVAWCIVDVALFMSLVGCCIVQGTWCMSHVARCIVNDACCILLDMVVQTVVAHTHTPLHADVLHGNVRLEHPF